MARWLNLFFFGELVLTPFENPENSQGHLWSSCHLRIRSERSLVASEIPQGDFLHRKRALLWFLFAQLQSMGGDMWPNLWLSSTFQHHPWYVKMLNLWCVMKFPLICVGAKVFNLWVCWPFWISLGMNTISKSFRSFFFSHWDGGYVSSLESDREYEVSLCFFRKWHNRDSVYIIYPFFLAIQVKITQQKMKLRYRGLPLIFVVPICLVLRWPSSRLGRIFLFFSQIATRYNLFYQLEMSHLGSDTLGVSCWNLQWLIQKLAGFTFFLNLLWTLERLVSPKKTLVSLKKRQLHSSLTVWNGHCFISFLLSISNGLKPRPSYLFYELPWQPVAICRVWPCRIMRHHASQFMATSAGTRA